tara:strand:+ start:55 stop:441 length:387 start_codon:yes stop_codon:yes gene_type:complete
MSFKIFFGIWVLGVLLLVSSCSWNNEEDLYGSTGQICDVSSVTLSGSVAPLLDYNCNGCHSTEYASSSGGNIVLDQYSLLKKYVDNGSLLGSIKHQSGYDAMPKSAAKLSACDILTIHTWIENGAENN